MQGIYETADRIKIKVRGWFEASAAKSSLALASDEILKALAPVDADAAILAAIQNPSGMVKNK